MLSNVGEKAGKIAGLPRTKDLPERGIFDVDHGVRVQTGATSLLESGAEKPVENSAVQAKSEVTSAMQTSEPDSQLEAINLYRGYGVRRVRGCTGRRVHCQFSRPAWTRRCLETTKQTIGFLNLTGRYGFSVN